MLNILLAIKCKKPIIIVIRADASGTSVQGPGVGRGMGVEGEGTKGWVLGESLRWEDSRHYFLEPEGTPDSSQCQFAVSCPSAQSFNFTHDRGVVQKCQIEVFSSEINIPKY